LSVADLAAKVDAANNFASKVAKVDAANNFASKVDVVDELLRKARQVKSTPSRCRSPTSARR
jgi:hypothetical protein